MNNANEQRCPLHGRKLVFSHNTIMDGIRLGVYFCPVLGCEALPEFGKPDNGDHVNRMDDDPQAGELVAA